MGGLLQSYLWMPYIPALSDPVVRAAETSATTDPLTWLINLGVAGIVIVLLVTGQLRTKSEVLHLLDEIAAKDKVIEAVQTQLLSQTLPALANSTRVIEAVPTTENALVRQLLRAQGEAKQAQDDALELIKQIKGLSGDDYEQ